MNNVFSVQTSCCNDLLARSSPLVILIFCSLDVFRTEISESILSLSPPVIGVLVWLILDGLTTNYPCWSMLKVDDFFSSNLSHDVTTSTSVHAESAHEDRPQQCGKTEKKGSRRTCAQAQVRDCNKLVLASVLQHRPQAHA